MQRVNKQCNMLQKHVYTAWGERLEQYTERGNWDRLLYVHEDVMGNTMYYTKATGQTFSELRYDVWGFPDLSGKLQNNDNGNFAAANFTGHTYDTVLDIYFAEARFYDASNRQWMAGDPIKSGLNWYEYVRSNPTTYFDPDGHMELKVSGEKGAKDTSTYYGDQVKNVQRMLTELGYMSSDYVTTNDGLNYTNTVGGATIGAARLFDFNYNGDYNSAVNRKIIDDELYLQIANQYINVMNPNVSAAERGKMYNEYMNDVRHADEQYDANWFKSAGSVNGYYRSFSCMIDKNTVLPDSLAQLGVTLRVDLTSLDNIIRLDLTDAINNFLKSTTAEVLAHRYMQPEEWMQKYNDNVIASQAAIQGYQNQFLATTLWFLEKDFSNKEWDIKVPKRFSEAFGFSNIHQTTDFFFEDQMLNAEELGNVTFGYWAAGLGYPMDTVYFGGGMTRIIDGLREFNFEPWKSYDNGYYGDDPSDIPFVQQGYDMFYSQHPDMKRP